MAPGYSKMLAKCFGSDYERQMEEYMNIAAEEDVMAAMKDIFETEISRSGMSDLETFLTKEYDVTLDDVFGPELYRYRDRIYRLIADIYLSATMKPDGEDGQIYEMGDNRREIGNWAESVQRQYSDKFDKLFDELQRKFNAQKDEALKSHPNFKEIPAAVAGKFRELGITVKTNSERVVFPGRRRFKDTEFDDLFSHWFFQDENGKNGVLYQSKETLKSRYGAKFGMGKDRFDGAWWHITSDADLADVYKLLAD
jgi:hypothetical protein